MISCDLSSSCFLFNGQLSVMTRSTEELRGKYCEGDYYECARFRLSRTCGCDKVPTYLYPDDVYTDCR